MSRIVVRDPGDAGPAARRMGTMTVTPQCDLVENGEGLILYCSLPGVAAKDISLCLDKRKLHLRCATDLPSLAGKIHALEFNDIVYERWFTIPPAVDGANIETSYRNGVLIIRLPFTSGGASCRILVSEW